MIIAAVLSHEKKDARSNPFALSSLRKVGLVANSVIALCIDVTSKGSQQRAAPPAISGNEVVLAINTGVPHYIASSNGIPNPSKWENTKHLNGVDSTNGK